MIGIIWLLALITYIICGLMLFDIIRRPIDYKYDTEVKLIKEETIVFLSHWYEITVTEKATGISETSVKQRYPDIYKNEQAWARMEAREIYKRMTAAPARRPKDNFKL